MSANGRFESLIASSTATIAYCAKGSIFRASLRSIKLPMSKFLISQANFVLKSLASKRVIGAAPDLPFFSPSQYSVRVLPIGVSAPSPVTTTRFKIMIDGVWLNYGSGQLFLHVLFQVRDSLANS